MNSTHIKGIITLTIIFGANGLMNKALSPKINISKYQFSLSADQLDLKKGAIYTLATTGDDASSIKWLSSNSKIATINKEGQIIAKEPGQTIISARVKKEYKDIVINVYNTLSSEVRIYNNSQLTTAESEAIDKISISKFKLTLSSNTYTYNGKAKKPKVQVETTDHKILKMNKDYEVKYSKNENVGTAKVVVTGINDYTGTLIGQFKIVKKHDISSTMPSQSNETQASSTVDHTASTTDDLSPTISSYTYSNLTPTSPTTSSSTSSSASKETTMSSSTKKSTDSTSKTSNSTTKNSTTKKKNTNNGTKKKSTSNNASSQSETSSSSSHSLSNSSSTTSSGNSNNTNSSNTNNSNSGTTNSYTNSSSSASNDSQNAENNSDTNNSLQSNTSESSLNTSSQKTSTAN